jgi:hypothetical protein
LTRNPQQLDPANCQGATASEVNAAKDAHIGDFRYRFGETRVSTSPWAYLGGGAEGSVLSKRGGKDLKGQFAGDYSRAGVQKSIGYFEDAIKKDPTFAPAYVGLAGAYRELGTPGVAGAPPREVRPK